MSNNYDIRAKRNLKRYLKPLEREGLIKIDQPSLLVLVWNQIRTLVEAIFKPT